MIRALDTLGGLAIAMLLALASLPWLMWALGRAACGDDAGADAAMLRAPLARWFDWVEARA